MGDFMVMPDNSQPDYTILLPWQSPASFYPETWSYRSWQIHVSEAEKVHEKLVTLIGVVSHGGKYLLNIGPKGDGSVIPFERDVLVKMGKWLAKNGEAIYGTSADPFPAPTAWGSVTAKTNKLYLHITHKPEGNKLTLPDLTGHISRVTRLGEKSETFPVKTISGGLEIILTENPSIENTPVLVVNVKNGYKVAPYKPIPLTNSTQLNSANVLSEYSNSGIDFYSGFRSIVAESWTVKTAKGGLVQPMFTFTEEEKGQTIELTINGKTTTVSLTAGQPIPLTNNLTDLQIGSDTWLSG